MTHKLVKLLLVAEIVVDDDDETPEHTASYLLDHFRETVGPTGNYGICLSTAQREDLDAFSAAGRLFPIPSHLVIEDA